MRVSVRELGLADSRLENQPETGSKNPVNAKVKRVTGARPNCLMD
jgi:hypothetical protein